MTTRRAVLRTLAGLPLLAGVTDTMLASLLRSNAGPKASMWIYLWDLVDEGYDTVLGRLKANGLTGISLASSYHAGKFLSPHNPKRKVIFLEDGTVYYRPNPRLYGRITPRTNSLVAAGHDLKEAKKHADQAGMDTRSWMVCCHNSPLGRAHPSAVTKTAFDDLLYHNLCPSNDDVRTYLRAMVRDIAGHGVSTIELEALQFQGYAHGEHHEREGIVLGTIPRFLLGLCFCDACTKRARHAGLDLSAVRTFVRTTLEEAFINPDAVAERYPTLYTLPAHIFEHFLEWRRSVITSLIGELRDASGVTALRPMVSIDPETRAMVGMDVALVSEITAGVLMPGYVRDPLALRGAIIRLQGVMGDREIIVGQQVGMPESGGKKEFLERMSIAREQGINAFNFYNYGFIPLERLEWIKEGLS